MNFNVDGNINNEKANEPEPPSVNNEDNEVQKEEVEYYYW